MAVVMDELDGLAARVFEGYIVRKDLARRFKGRYPVPEYVAEFLLGRYCASTDEGEIAEGLGIVEMQMRERTGRPLAERTTMHGDRHAVHARSFGRPRPRQGSHHGGPFLRQGSSPLRNAKSRRSYAGRLEPLGWVMAHEASSSSQGCVSSRSQLGLAIVHSAITPIQGAQFRRAYLSAWTSSSPCCSSARRTSVGLPGAIGQPNSVSQICLSSSPFATMTSRSCSTCRK